jgi:hypothetical protein
MTTVNLNEWGWQGFFGPLNHAIASKAAVEAAPAHRVGGVFPPPGQPPVPVDPDNTVFMWAVHTRGYDPWPTPTNMTQARPDIVDRLVGASG